MWGRTGTAQYLCASRLFQTYGGEFSVALRLLHMTLVAHIGDQYNDYRVQTTAWKFLKPNLMIRVFSFFFSRRRTHTSMTKPLFLVKYDTLSREDEVQPQRNPWKRHCMWDFVGESLRNLYHETSSIETGMDIDETSLSCIIHDAFSERENKITARTWERSSHVELADLREKPCDEPGWLSSSLILSCTGKRLSHQMLKHIMYMTTHVFSSSFFHKGHE